MTAPALTPASPTHDTADEPSDGAVEVSPGRLTAAVVGATAAATALAAGQLASAIVGSEQSPITAVGTEFIDRFAARLKDLAVAIFGTNDKTALVTGIVVVAIGLGAALGLAARRRWAVVPVGFGAFGAVGAWAMATDPRGEAADALVSAGVAALAGIGVFAVLWRVAAGNARRPQPVASSVVPAPADAAPRPALDRRRRTTFDRRAFVVGVGGVLVASGAATLVAGRVRSGNSVNALRRSTVLPRPRRSTLPPATQPFESDVAGLSPYVTPVEDFYRIDTALVTPQVGSAGWKLAITGLVDEPFEIDYEELLALASVEETVTIVCVSNEIGGRLIGNAVWQGVPLAALLERAGVRPEATQIVGRSVDGFTAGFPTATALDGRTALVAYAMNGEPLTADHGYPARLIVSGLYGYVSATKWLSEIELTTWEDFDGYWVPRGWSKEGPVKTMSRIDVPRHRAELAAGPQPIAGVAWAQNTGIERVEVQVDDGEWIEAELGRTASDDTWVQWHVAWDAAAGEHQVRVRATDRSGYVQTADRAEPAPDGATGWHTRTVTVR